MPTRYETWYGRDEPPRELRELRAGPLTAQLDGADLRYVRLGSLEVVRRIYAAVRDPNWGTVPMEINALEVEQGGDSFRVRFDARNRRGALDFQWRGTIIGSRDGTIVYDLDGQAAADFRHNKIGLNIHHPIAGVAGHPYHGTTPGGPISGTLPDTVGPQRMDGGIDHPLFDPVSNLTIEMDGGVRVRFAFEGDLAEMEDQRNWSDASYKTYLPPQKPGFPYLIRKGERVHQRITISATGRAPERTQAPSVDIALGRQVGPLPAIGLGMASDGRDLTSREAELLGRARPDHLRAVLHLRDMGWRAELERARRAAAALGARLELAIFVADAAEAQLADLVGPLSGLRPMLARLLIFHEQEEATSSRTLQMARDALAPLLDAVPLGGGTNVYLCELNRNRPADLALMDGVAYSVNPQVHAFDELSLAEAVAAQADQVRTVRSFCGDRPIWVSPVTLRPRFNAVATEDESGPAPDELPWPVDPRQTSLFAAAWTVGSIAHLAQSGAASVTYYETAGWRGLLERELGSPRPDLFPSRPGMVFPIYHVLADLGELKGSTVVQAVSSRPLAVVALALENEDGLHVLAANLTAEEQSVTVGPIAARHISWRMLDETAPLAGSEPSVFRSTSTPASVDGDRLALRLAPFATARIDASLPPVEHGAEREGVSK